VTHPHFLLIILVLRQYSSLFFLEFLLLSLIYILLCMCCYSFSGRPRSPVSASPNYWYLYWHPVTCNMTPRSYFSKPRHITDSQGRTRSLQPSVLSSSFIKSTRFWESFRPPVTCFTLEFLLISQIMSMGISWAGTQGDPCTATIFRYIMHSSSFSFRQ
jgi:hypothetical protein